MNLVARAQAIITKPKETWPVIADEPETTQGLYTNYIMPLAAIGPIATFVGSILFGYGYGAFSVRPSIASALVGAILSYVLALIGCYITATIASELAPSFGGMKGTIQGLKLAAYSSTALWVASIVEILPQLSIIALIAGLYGLYVLYLGVQPVMKVPADKQAIYTLILVVVSIVVFFVIGVVVRALRVAAMGLTGV